MMSPKGTPEQVVDRLLQRHGRTYAEELGINLRGGKPGPLFNLLVAALLMSARISSDIAVAAAKVLFDRGYTTAGRMAAATWQERVDALGAGGYVRYDESTSRYLGESSELLLDRYGGDLRGLREEAQSDTDRIRARVEQCKGIGKVGSGIFCREVQGEWGELQPFLDDAALRVARDLGIGDDPEAVASHVGASDLSRIAAALMRAKLDRDLPAVRDGQDAPPTRTQLALMSRRELYDLARQAGVPGRSAMRRDQLAEALRG